MSLYAVTVLGQDRPGIVADVTGLLADLGGNLEDSTMTLLRGHFAMVLLVRTDAALTSVQAAMGPLASGLSVEVREVPDEPAHPVEGTPYVVSVHGADRPGIVSAVTAVVAEVGGNVTDLSTRLAGDLYVLLAEVDLPAGVDESSLAARLRATADELGVDVTLHPADTDEL